MVETVVHNRASLRAYKCVVLIYAISTVQNTAVCVSQKIAYSFPLFVHIKVNHIPFWYRVDSWNKISKSADSFIKIPAYSQPSLQRRCSLPNNVMLNRIAVVMNVNLRWFYTFTQLQLTL